jgi:ribulose 1,5-bisphosphate synthetase/thiazole synthase
MVDYLYHLETRVLLLITKQESHELVDERKALRKHAESQAMRDTRSGKSGLYCSGIHTVLNSSKLLWWKKRKWNSKE